MAEIRGATLPKRQICRTVSDPIDGVQESPPQAFLPLTESYEKVMFLL
jgi:hypothetical protein